MKKTLQTISIISLVWLSSILTSCATAPINYQQLLLGQWDTEMLGSPVVIEFSDSTIKVVDGLYTNMFSSYQVNGNVISYDFQGLQEGTMEVVSDNEIVQTNTVTQERMVLKRHN